MVFACRQKRILRIVAFIGVACIIFLCFQVFLVGFLDYDANVGLRRGARPKFGLDDELRAIDVSGGRTKTTQYPPHLLQKLKSECSSHNCSIVTALVGSTLRVISRTQFMSTTTSTPSQSFLDDSHVGISQFKNVWELLEHNFPRPFILDKNIGMSEEHSTRGVNRRWQYLYEADEHMQYTCILSQEKIPFAQVNDDYCDCLDSSDEPGTSACSDGRFYCTFQQADNPKWLTSGHVNDGICDCCDGSDEWQRIQLPEHIAIHDGLAHYGIYQSPCTDHCQELRQQEDELLSMRLRGVALRHDYLKAGFDNGNNEKLYGPGAVFYKLSTACMETTVGKYTYSVCPFGPVKQTEHGQSVVIGRRAKWLDRGPSIYRLLLDEGDTTNCPAARHRRTTVIFECGDRDRVMSITESEVCQYVIKISTPAAC